MRRLAQLGWIYLLFASGMLWLTKRRLSRRRAIVVLTLHRVLDEAEYAKTSSPQGMIVRRQTFAAMAAYLKRKCDIVDVSAGWSDRPGTGGRVRVAITFDDGWKDTLTEVFPIANEQAMPITVFLCPDLQGLRFPFWPERAVRWWRHCAADGQNGEPPTKFPSPDSFVAYLKQIDPAERTSLLARAPSATLQAEREEPCNKTLNWDETRALSQRGVTFGSHTSSHSLLPQMQADQITRELRDSQRAIEQELGKPCALFAYPNGDWTPSVRDEVENSGYRWAFTTKPGAWTESSDPFLIPRINIYEKKLKGLFGGFSRASLDYCVFWKAAWAAASPDTHRSKRGAAVRLTA